jgi:IS5 family transposase
MNQPGFFDLSDRYAKLDSLGDPLPKIDAVIDWGHFRPVLAQARRKQGKTAAGRPPFDALLMFKVLVLQSFYNLSDDQAEFQIRDRYSFQRFLGLAPEGRVPDAKTIWLFRETLKDHNLIGKLFAALDNQIELAGYIPRKGQIIDASIVEAPRQRNSKDENDMIKSGFAPADWSEPKRRQKDVDARWTKKNGQIYYGYKNHVGVDRESKLIRAWEAASASVHDSQIFYELLDDNNSCNDVWADSAYWSQDRAEEMAKLGYRSRVHRKGVRGRELTEADKKANRLRSRVRARVEHVFAQQGIFGKFIRTIGYARARLKIGMMNLAYNMKRLAWLTANVKPADGRRAVCG